MKAGLQEMLDDLKAKIYSTTTEFWIKFSSKKDKRLGQEGNLPENVSLLIHAAKHMNCEVDWRLWDNGVLVKIKEKN